jgi:predicted dehydrogenase
MPKTPRIENTAGSTRRTFLHSSGAAVGTTLSAGPLLSLETGRARADEELGVALIGCGGRGTGAAGQALSTKGSLKLIAMADAFSDRLEGSLKTLKKSHAERIDVPEDRRFTGFDAYKNAIETPGVDVVILATPPGFRPIHFEHAIAQDKHVFMEKPVAVDGAGIRQVLAAAEVAKTKNLKVGVGLQRHHDPKYIETVERIRAGELGDPILYRCYWNSGGVWTRNRKDSQTEMEYQMRNWYYFNWLCGDHIVEQHIHNIDVCNWIHGGPPVMAQGQGGRQIRTGKDHGEIFDHHMVEFSYADGSKMLSQCRHQSQTWSSVSEHVHATKGTANVSGGRMEFSDGSSWRFRGDKPNPYQVEHDVLFAAIREDTPHNEADYGASSTMTSILGRYATYSGRPVSYEEALNSKVELRPDAYTFNGTPPSVPDADGNYPIARPGSTKPF